MPFLVVWRRLSKGNQVNIPEPEFLVRSVKGAGWSTGSNVCACGYQSAATQLNSETLAEALGKSFLFFLTRTPQPSHKDPEIRLPGARVFGAVKHSTISRVSGAPLTVLENPREISHL